MLWEDRLLYTGSSLEEACQKAQLDIDQINQNLSQAVGRPIRLQSAPDLNTALPLIQGQTAYCNITKPIQYWIDNYNAMYNVNNFYGEAVWQQEWDLPVEP